MENMVSFYEEFVETSDAAMICGFNNIEATAKYIASNHPHTPILKIILADHDRLSFVTCFKLLYHTVDGIINRITLRCAYFMSSYPFELIFIG